MITYSATLDVPVETATLVTDLLIAERRRRGTGVGSRAASARTQALLVLRWFREDTGMPTLARDAGVSTATGYRYLHEGIDVLAAAAPDLREVLEAGQAAGWTHVVLDGTLIRTDRCRTKNPDTGHDLWFSGKHKAHGGNVQIVSDPDGHPVAVSEVEPGSVHDLAAARRTGEVQIGQPSGAAMTCTLPPWARCLPEYHRSWPVSGLTVRQRSVAISVPSTVTWVQPSALPAASTAGSSGAEAASTSMPSCRYR